MINLTLIFVLKLLGVISLVWLALLFKSFAPWVPGRKKDLDRIAKIVGLQDGQIMYELGCGDGRVAARIAGLKKGRVIGIERAWPMFLVCKLRQFFYPMENLEFRFKDIYKTDLSQADVIYLFTMPQNAERVVNKLISELKPQATIISYCFELPKLKLMEKDLPSGSIAIYKYSLPG